MVNTYYELWGREITTNTSDFTLIYKELIKTGTETSLLTGSTNPGALMEYKMRTSNKAFNS